MFYSGNLDDYRFPDDSDENMDIDMSRTKFWLTCGSTSYEDLEKSGPRREAHDFMANFIVGTDRTLRSLRQELRSLHHNNESMKQRLSALETSQRDFDRSRSGDVGNRENTRLSGPRFSPLFERPTSKYHKGSVNGG